MAYELEEFCNDCRAALKADPGDGGREQVRQYLEKLLDNADFVAANCAPDAERGRHTLYHDDELDFHVLAHVYDKGQASSPHNHGSSWAAYGQAVGKTEMTVWRRTDDGSKEGRASLEVADRFHLEPGKAGVFHPGDIHSIDFTAGSRFIRVTGTDIAAAGQTRFNLKEGTFEIAEPVIQGA